VAAERSGSVFLRVRILSTPVEQELDGVRLDVLTPGSVRDVSVPVATWLIAQGYAQTEMRHVDEDPFSHTNHRPIPPTDR
jgi:hypothetical protein